MVYEGFKTIAQVRKAVKEGVLKLDWRQHIGLECYEDFRDKMNRCEVEKIAEIAREAVLERFPKAEVQLMGSYRRGSTALGDVDLLITDPSYLTEIPKGALGELVSRLERRGHMAFHLSMIEGIDTALPSSQSSGDMALPVPDKKSFSSQTYFGVSAPMWYIVLIEVCDTNICKIIGQVFNSPVVRGRRRRIDIKFYPRRERAFASLYFTGSGYFNRSMRLWSKRVKRLRLNDHGLFPDSSIKHNVPSPHQRLPLEAETEAQVFDILGLVYKEPHERDCFDAVIGKDGVASVQFEPSTAELQSENNGHHPWID